MRLLDSNVWLGQCRAARTRDRAFDWARAHDLRRRVRGRQRAPRLDAR